MKKFSISLNQSQELFLASCLPKGYSFVKLKENSNSNHSIADSKKIKSSGDHQNIERDPLSQSAELSSQNSNSHQSHFKHKGKKSNQSKESIPKEKPKSKLTKISSSSQNQKNSQKASILHKLLNEIEKKKSSSIFIEPVDPVKLQIPNYFDIIKRPMAIQTMRKKLKQGKYEEFSSFEEDLETIVSNCIKFNAGNNFFIQLAKRFSNEYKKVLQKFKEQINRNFKMQADMEDKSIEPNSEQQTNSDDKIENKHQKKIHKKDLTIKKIQQKEEQNLKKPLNNYDKINVNEIKSPQNKQTPNEEMKSTEQRNQQSKVQNKIEKDKNQIQKEEQQSTAKKGQKASSKNDIKIKIKKYSYEDRLIIISRIKKLDRSTLSQFFKDINFSKGESLDFKVLEEEKIKGIEEKLKIYERIHQQKMKEAIKFAQEKKSKQDFEIEEDKDYQD